ncbi:MAG: AMP-binding protein [Proteobacteria bacterium]|nr:AMP-binding protein [Pseudomonadota bacterium]
MSNTLMDRASEHGVSIVQTYGLTEASSQVATAVPGSSSRSTSVVGPPLDGFSVRIVGPHEEMGPGEHGRIEIEGRAVFSGYLGQEHRSEPFLTSDIGFITADGSLGVVGRGDDIIVVGGNNVSTGALREVIVSMAGVRDAIVVGIPDAEWGSVPGVVIDLDATYTIDAIEDSVTDRVERGHAPHRWIAAAVPLLPNGKHDRVTAQRMLTGL